MHESEAVTKDYRHSSLRISLPQLKRVNNPKSIHGIYPYRGKMSAIDAAHVISQLSPEDILLDPFCGTGTILYEAQAHGMNAIGVDNNPLACIIARGKTEHINHERTLEELDEVIEVARAIRKPQSMPSWARKFFHPDTADQVMSVMEASEGFGGFLQSALYGTICLSARACNGWLWTSTSIGRINRPLRRVDFFSALRRKTKKHLPFVKGSPKVDVHVGDTREIHNIIPDDSVDVVYTSPPYFDALDYTGYYTRLVMEIIGIDRARVREGLIQRYSTYRDEMKKALVAIDRVARDDALIIFVVGDKKIHGRLIRGADLFSEIAPWDDPYVVEREYTQTASGVWDKINKTRRKEQVVVWDLETGGK
jgi:16S rRNA G966 N2-methylase RsmD